MALRKDFLSFAQYDEPSNMRTLRSSNTIGKICLGWEAGLVDYAWHFFYDCEMTDLKGLPFWRVQTLLYKIIFHRTRNDNFNIVLPLQLCASRSHCVHELSFSALGRSSGQVHSDHQMQQSLRVLRYVDIVTSQLSCRSCLISNTRWLRHIKRLS